MRNHPNDFTHGGRIETQQTHQPELLVERSLFHSIVVLRRRNEVPGPATPNGILVPYLRTLLCNRQFSSDKVFTAGITTGQNTTTGGCVWQVFRHFSGGITRHSGHCCSVHCINSGWQSSSKNRPVRTRMSGCVGRAISDGGSYPILLYHLRCHCSGRSSQGWIQPFDPTVRLQTSGWSESLGPQRPALKKHVLPRHQHCG